MRRSRTSPAATFLIPIAAAIGMVALRQTVAWADDGTHAVATDAVELPEALFGDDSDARSAAIERLKQQPHAAVPALLAAIDADDFDRRVKAGEALLAVVPRDAKAAEAIARAIDAEYFNQEL